MLIKKYEPKKVNIKGYVRNDCTINAIGTALGISYDLARKLLQTGINRASGFSFYEKGPRTKQEFSMRSNVLQICDAISVDKNIFITEEIRRQRIKSSSKYRGLGTKDNSVAKFAESNPEGVFILLVHGHLLTVINGYIIDNFDPSNMAVEIAFKIDVKQARGKIKELAKFYRMDNKEHYEDNIKIVNKLAKAS